MHAYIVTVYYSPFGAFVYFLTLSRRYSNLAFYCCLVCCVFLVS